MSSKDHDISNIRQATARLAGLSSHGRVPDPEVEDDARRDLAHAKLQRALREAQSSAPALNPHQVEHLVGLLMAPGGTDEHAAERLERAVREAVHCTRDLTPSDRERIAAVVLGKRGRA